MTHDDKAARDGQPAPTHRHLDRRDDIRDSIAALLEQARRQIRVLAPRLEHNYFNTGRVQHALARFMARHRENRAQFLVEDAEQVMHDNARLVELARRFPEFIQIHQVGAEDIGLGTLRVISDRHGLLSQPDVSEIDTELHLDDPHAAIPAGNDFDARWARSEPLAGLHAAGLSP